jgi:hypothetical protein
VTVAATLVLEKKANEHDPNWIKAYSDLVRATGNFVKKPGLRALVDKQNPPESETYKWERMGAETRQSLWEYVRQQRDWYEKNVPRPPA